MTTEAVSRTPKPQVRRRRIGEVLVEAGVVTGEQIESCVAKQAMLPREKRKRLGTIIIEDGLATESDVARAVARVLGLATVDLANTPVSTDAARMIPRSLAERYGLLGLEYSAGVLRLAMADPTDVVALDDVRIATKVKSTSVVVATESAIRTYLGRIWTSEEDASDVVASIETDDATEEDDDGPSVDDTPIVRLANVIIADAIRSHASDIHLEPGREDMRVRFRIDGLLRDVMTLPKSVTSALTSRIKIVSGIDIAERRRPQDGRSRFLVDGMVVDARVSTLLTMHGEKVVIRLLSRQEGVTPLARVGLSDSQLETFLETIIAPQGLILITGPTGSGKTSTLYSAVSQLRTPERNIVTLEDPVEIELPGINQMQVNEKAGVTFAAGLRAVLRQDPDVVLVGEVRDMETAELAMRASLTGHLVFTTLHTNDAAAAVTRLVDMGVEPFLIASSLALVVAQRLVRVPCPSCAAPYVPSPRTLELLGLVPADVENATLLRGRGCEACGDTGYRGRAAIFEVLEVDAAMRAILTGRPTEATVRAAARAAGAHSLRTDGIAKALRGETTLEEVLRVTQVDASHGPRCQSCRRGLDTDMAYCPWCAAAVEQTGCLGCGKTQETEWRVCPWCRTPHENPAYLSPPPDPDEALAPRRPKALVVDDDASICAYVGAALAEVCDVVTASTAEEGLRVCGTHDIDVAILDLRLPDLTGFELARLLRSDTRTALIPLLLLTGADDPSVRAEALLAGLDDCLGKPVDPMLLEERVTKLLARSASR